LKVQRGKLRVFEIYGGISKRVEVRGISEVFPIFNFWKILTDGLN
jgi:hypothetical protein